MKCKTFIKIGILLIVLSISSLTVNSLYFFINEYEKDVSKGKEIEKNVNDLYSSFLTSISLYEDVINQTYDSFNLYLNELPSVNSKLLENIENVKNAKRELNDVSKKIQDNCSNSITSSVFVQKCNKHLKAEENVEKVYNNMINDYNSIVEKYNIYAEKNHKELIELLK